MSSYEHLSLLACQADIPETCCKADRDRHLAAFSDRVRFSLSRNRADLVVLPELSSVEYSRNAFDRLPELAEPMDGPSFETWGRVAREFETCVAYSFARRDGDDHFITLAVVSPEGSLIGHYDKIHLAQFGASVEKEYFTRGERLLVFEVNGFAVAPIICADIRIPELSRILAVEHGVDLVLHSGAYFRDPSFYSWHSFAVTRALENQVYFLSLNRAGADYGNSLFCPPWVDESRQPTVFSEHEEQFTRLVVERGEIELARERYSFLKDRLASYDLPVDGRRSTQRLKEVQ